MSNCIVCGRPLKSKQTLQKGMGKKCAKIFSTYDPSVQQQLFHAYQSGLVIVPFDNPQNIHLTKATSLLLLLKHDNLEWYQEALHEQILHATEPEKSLLQQQLWETENGMIALYQREREKEPRLPEIMNERLTKAVFRLYRKEQTTLSPEKADALLPAFQELLRREEVKEQEGIQQELDSFGTEFFSDGDVRIDPTHEELPKDESREYYYNVLYSIFRDSDEQGYTQIHLEELNRQALYRIANLYYQLSRRYLSALKNVPRVSTFQEFNQANQVTGLKFHRIMGGINPQDHYESCGGFYLNGENQIAHYPSYHPKKIPEIGIYFNELTLNDEYTKMSDFYKKDSAHDTTYFVKVPEHYQYRDYIITHETGHAIQDQLNFQSPAYQQIIDIYDKNRNTLASQLSRYATVSPDEMIAEAFTDYTLNTHPSQISIDVMNILEGHFHSTPRLEKVDSQQAELLIRKAKFNKPSREKELLTSLLPRQ